jgi:hypothetical protein
MPEESRPVTTEARIRPLRPSDFAPVIAVIDEWWGGRAMARMLPRLFFDHFTDTSFAADRDGALAGFLVGFAGWPGTTSRAPWTPGRRGGLPSAPSGRQLTAVP